MEDLKKFNLNEEDVLNLKQSAAYEDFMHFQLKRCELIYEEAFLKFSSFPRKPLLAAWMMGKIYFEILKELKKKPSISLQKKISLSKFRKLKILIQEYFHA